MFVNRGGPTNAEFRMQILEDIALTAKNVLTSQKLTGFANQVEKYYAGVVRGEDLKDL